MRVEGLIWKIGLTLASLSKSTFRSNGILEVGPIRIGRFAGAGDCLCPPIVCVVKWSADGTLDGPGQPAVQRSVVRGEKIARAGGAGKPVFLPRPLASQEKILRGEIYFFFLSGPSSSCSLGYRDFRNGFRSKGVLNPPRSPPLLRAKSDKFIPLPIHCLNCSSKMPF